MYNNTLVNSTVCIGRTGRSAVGDHFGWHPSTGPDVDERYGHIFVNNLLTGDENFHRPLLNVWQTDTLCKWLDKTPLKQLDYNVYVRGHDKTSFPLILWSPAMNDECQISFDSPGDLNALNSKFEAHSRSFTNDIRPFFQSDELGNYRILKGFPGTEGAMKLPAEVMKLLKYPEKEGRFAGAYPPLP